MFEHVPLRQLQARWLLAQVEHQDKLGLLVEAVCLALLQELGYHPRELCEVHQQPLLSFQAIEVFLLGGRSVLY